METYEIAGSIYTTADLLDSVMDGVCRECGEVTYPHEPDAVDNWCECCGANAVASVLELALDQGL